jgi:hypothetical protein
MRKLAALLAALPLVALGQQEATSTSTPTPTPSSTEAAFGPSLSPRPALMIPRI